MAKVLLGQSSQTYDDASAYFLPIGMNTETEKDSVETAIYNTFRIAGTLSGLYTYVTSNDETTNRVFRVRKNTTDGSQLVTITAGNTGVFEDTSNSDIVTAGDEFAFKMDQLTTGKEIQIRVCAVSYESTVNVVTKFFVQGGGQEDSPLYRKFVVNGSTSTTESDVAVNVLIGGTTKNLFVNVPFNEKTLACVIRTRLNGANGNITVSVTALTTGIFEDTSNTDTVVMDDDYNYSETCADIINGSYFSVISLDIENTLNNSTYISGGVETEIGTTNYGQIAGGGNSSTEASVQLTHRSSATISNLYTFVSFNDSDGNGTFRFRKNATNGNQVVTLTASTTGAFEDTSNSDSIVNGDEIDVSATLAGTTGAITKSYMSAIVTFLSSSKTNLPLLRVG